MHVKGKMMAFCGLFIALSVVCMSLGSVIETNTLFLLAAASFFVGIVIREFGMRTVGAFYVADVLLGLLIAPNKFYVFSFAAMGLYIVIIEAAWRFLGRSSRTQRQTIFWAVKYMAFNVMYIPMQIFFEELILGGQKLSPIMTAGIWIAGQIALFIYDRAYEYVQAHVWTTIRGRMF